MIVVAAQLDDSSERIIRYLQEHHEIDINAVFFSVYQVVGQEMLVRAWLADPVETQQRAEAREKAPWTGTWFVNTGIDDSGDKRDWKACRKNGFLSARRWTEVLRSIVQTSCRRPHSRLLVWKRLCWRRNDKNRGHACR